MEKREARKKVERIGTGRRTDKSRAPSARKRKKKTPQPRSKRVEMVVKSVVRWLRLKPPQYRKKREKVRRSRESLSSKGRFRSDGIQ